jgi:MoaA/NifB/PqqE/SkfB family radical SAM enzyme
MTFSPFRHVDSIFWKRRPIQLTFFVTRRCNARCSFCFYSSRQPPHPDPVSDLTLEEAGKVSSSLGNLLWLAFSGGEIFLRKDIVDLAEVFYRNNRPALILLPTNGLLPDTVAQQTEAILRRCPESTIVVKLSLDGTREVHDDLRGVPGSFDRTLSTYEKTRELLGKYPNFELGVNTVFCAANQDRIDDVIDLVSTLDGIHTHTVSLIRGSVPEPSLKKVDLKKYRKVLERLESGLGGGPSCRYRFRGGRIKAAQDILQRRLIYETGRKESRLVPCYAGTLSLVLNEKGDLFPCEILTDRLGNVRESAYDIGRILRSDKGRTLLESIRRGNCYCTHECNFMMNIFFNPRLYPPLLREYARLLLSPD